MFEAVATLRRAIEAVLRSYPGTTASFYNDPHVNTPTLEVHDRASGRRLVRAVYRYSQENDDWQYGLREEPFPADDLERQFWFKYAREPNDPAARASGSTAEAIEWTTEQVRGRLSPYADAGHVDQIATLKEAYVALSRQEKERFLDWVRAQALDPDDTA